MEKVEQSDSDLITLIPCLPFRNGDASRKKKRKKEETDVCCKLADSKKWRKRAANVCNCLRETAGWIDTDMYIYMKLHSTLPALTRNFVQLYLVSHLRRGIPSVWKPSLLRSLPPCLLWFAICRKKNSVERSTRLPGRTFNLVDDLFFLSPLFFEPNWTTLRVRLEPTVNPLPLKIPARSWIERGSKDLLGEYTSYLRKKQACKQTGEENWRNLAICSPRFGS